MTRDDELPNGYYWARHPDGTHFVVLREGGAWYCCGLIRPIVNFHESQIVMRIPWPLN